MGFFKKFSVTGLGYKIWSFFKTICFFIGYSHYSLLKISKNLVIKFRKKLVLLYCFDKQIINNITYLFLNLKKPDKYKGKGIRDVQIRLQLKVGKKR